MNPIEYSLRQEIELAKQQAEIAYSTHLKNDKDLKTNIGNYNRKILTQFEENGKSISALIGFSRHLQKQLNTFTQQNDNTEMKLKKLKEELDNFESSIQKELTDEKARTSHLTTKSLRLAARNTELTAINTNLTTRNTELIAQILTLQENEPMDLEDILNPVYIYFFETNKFRRYLKPPQPMSEGKHSEAGYQQWTINL